MVIAVIAMIISLLMPSLLRARELANRSVCSQHIKTLIIAALTYAEYNDGRMVRSRPPYWGRDGSENGILSWHWALGPYLGVKYWDPEENGYVPGMRWTSAWTTREINAWEAEKPIFYKTYGCPSWRGQFGQHNWGASYYQNQSLGLNSHILGRRISDIKNTSEWLVALDQWCSYLDWFAGNNKRPPSIMAEMAYGWVDSNGVWTVWPRHMKEGITLGMLDGHVR